MAISSDLVRFFTTGPLMTSGYGPPTADPQVAEAPPGSFYICRDDGVWWQKQAGPTWSTISGGGGGPGSVVTLANGEAGAVAPGAPVAVLGGMARLGDASSYVLSLLVGVVLVGAGPTLPLQIMTQGPVSLPTSEWDAITGGSGGLVPGAIYYLSPVAGQLVTAPPSGVGRLVAVVGQALSDQALLVGLRSPVLL